MTTTRRWRWGTAARLATFLGVVLALVLGLALLGLLRAFSSQTDASTTRSLVAELRAFAAAAAQRPPSQSMQAFSDGYLRTRIFPDGETLTIGFTDGPLLGSAGSEPLLRTAIVRQWAAAAPPAGTRRHVTVGAGHYLLVAAPVVTEGKPIGMVAAAADLAQAGRDLGRVRNLAIGEGVIALLAGCLGAYLLLRRLLRRIVTITDTAADLGSGALDRRLRNVGETDEVGQLSSTFDAMADQLSEVMMTQRRLLSDVSHQLRTPLTVARGHLEVLQRSAPYDPADVHDTVDVVLDEIDHMKALVERLLMLGRAMEPDFLEREPVDLRSFCVDLVDAARVLADRRWLLGTVPDVVVVVDAAKLRGAVLNLLDNAVKVTGPGDIVALSADVVGGEVLLAVEDSGPGIPVERRSHALERFARPGAADSQGSGLGLAIVRAVAEAHGGTVAIEDSQYGGCRVALRLPVVSDALPAGTAYVDTGEEPTCVS